MVRSLPAFAAGVILATVSWYWLGVFVEYIEKCSPIGG